MANQVKLSDTEVKQLFENLKKVNCFVYIQDHGPPPKKKNKVPWLTIFIFSILREILPATSNDHSRIFQKKNSNCQCQKNVQPVSLPTPLTYETRIALIHSKSTSWVRDHELGYNQGITRCETGPVNKRCSLSCPVSFSHKFWGYLQVKRNILQVLVQTDLAPKGRYEKGILNL